MKTVNDIRNEFLDYFEKRGHEIVASSSLVPDNDPTLMFTNAGMNQFKNVFTGKETRDYNRATTSQKCVRAGGKHNDLENVGYTARHHTFFEMLGNFSFGDYFKDDAIAMAWELLTKNYGLDAEKMCVTIYHTDDEAFDIWKKVTGFHDDKIIRIPTSDNFWAMGDTGPCGPCTEIFYDHGEHIPGGPPGSPEEDGDRFIEIWNNVFMQYEQIDLDTRIDLPNPSIDTGMGLERIAATMMGSNNNYDIDILQDIMCHSADLTSVDKDGEQAASHKVIADHLRAASFLIADGVMPSNEGRGYVLRRIMRRGMRHAHLLGAVDPLMYKLFPTLLGSMGEAFPDLHRANSLITETLKSEEERFKVTLDKGLKSLDDEIVEGDMLAGDVAFKLHDTFGFPLDLTQDALKAHDMSVDTDGFDKCMEEQKAKARAAWKGSGDTTDDKVWFDILDEIGATEFLGYEVESAEGEVKAIIKDGKRVDALKKGETGFVLTNQTPFYAESGGQIGDSGTLSVIGNDTSSITVTDTKKHLASLHSHYVRCNEGGVSVGDALGMVVDHTRRSDIRSNHSATHLLHEALRRVLGEHVSQKGSLQDAERTRFDVSHTKGITTKEIAQVEAIVNDEIRANTPITTRLMGIDEARDTGAMALFGEKYADEVRVVTMGTQPKGATKAFSVELCGGTHASNTGDIGRFKIVSEGALSSGVRRIEAVTGARVDQYEQGKAEALQAELDRLIAENQKRRDELKSFRAFGGTNPDEEFVSIIDDSLDESQRLEKENKKLSKLIANLRRAEATAQATQSDDDIQEIVGMKFIGKVLEGFPAKDLKPMADDLKAKLGSGVVVLVATDEGKASIVVAVTDDLTDKISAVDLVRVGSEALGGKGGGGRPDMAQAGGPNAMAANDAVNAIEVSLAG